MAQVIVCLTSKHEALNPNPSTAKTKKERKEKKIEMKCEPCSSGVSK
jgi:hypothetical protein